MAYPYTNEQEAYLRDHPDMPGEELERLPLFEGRTAYNLEHKRAVLLRTERRSPGQARHIRELERQASGDHPKRDLINEWPALAASPKPKLENPIRLPASDVVALFDIHVPIHDADWMTRVLNLADALGIKTCVLGGDAFDITTFSKFGHEPDDSFEQELEAAENLFSRFASQFTNTYFLQGNHERRIFRTLDAQLRAERFLRLFTHAKNVHVTPFEWIEMDGRPGDYPWLFGHPKNSSIIPGRVPGMIGSRGWTGHHIATGHGHLWGIVQSDDGDRYMVDVGMCADPERMGYAVLSLSTRPRMHQGALIVKDGFPWLLHPKMDLERLARAWQGEAA